MDRKLDVGVVSVLPAKKCHFVGLGKAFLQADKRKSFEDVKDALEAHLRRKVPNASCELVKSLHHHDGSEIAMLEDLVSEELGPREPATPVDLWAMVSDDVLEHCFCHTLKPVQSPTPSPMPVSQVPHTMSPEPTPGFAVAATSAGTSAQQMPPAMSCSLRHPGLAANADSPSSTGGSDGAAGLPTPQGDTTESPGETRDRDRLQLRLVRASSGKPKRHVFVSHSGVEKRGIVATILKRFKDLYPNVEVFVDDYSMKPAEEAEVTMIEACGMAHVGIAIVSESFVGKFWPMRELFIMLERRQDKADTGKLLPVAYFKDWEQFERKVEEYRKCPRDSREHFWAQDLGLLSDFVSFRQERTEDHVLADRVVERAVQLLRDQGVMPVSVEQPTAIGFEEQAEQLLARLQAKHWLWLHGPGGLGKTTMAKLLQHNLLESGLVSRSAVVEFDFTFGSSSSSCQNLTDLKQKAVQQLSNKQDNDADAYKRYVQMDKVLLVLDNLHTLSQLHEFLAGVTLAESSMLVVTSRRSSPLGADTGGTWQKVRHKLHPPWQLGCLPYKAALALFCANRQPVRPDGVPDVLEQRVVKACGGLPLAVAVASGCLHDKHDAADWEAVACALEGNASVEHQVMAASEHRLENVLLHSLEDATMHPAVVSMFLDVACVMHGERQQDAMAAWGTWHAGRPGAAALFDELVTRNLVSVDIFGCLQMHDVLRWLGRRIVLGDLAFQDGLFTGSRMWIHGGEVAQYHTKDATTRKMVMVAQLVGAHARVQPAACGYDLSTANVMLVDDDSRFLAVQAASNLLWLRGVGLRSLPAEVGQLSVLQTLDLWDCSGLTSLPAEVGQLRALQTLNLVLCSGLTSLPAEVGQLSALQTLNLRHCSGLTMLPAEVGQLSALQTLHLWGCSRLTSLPAEVGQLSALQWLHLLGCSGLTSLPAELGQLSALQTLALGGCSGLTSLPAEVGQLEGRGSLIIRK